MKGDWKNEQLSTVLFGDFIFLMTYAGIMSEKIHRTICALAGAAP